MFFMSTALLLSSLVSGFIAITLTMLLLYLPVFWGGNYHDILTSLSGALFKRVGQGSRLAAAFFLFVAGIFTALFYAWFTLQFIEGVFPTPQVQTATNTLGSFSFFYLLIGAVAGFAQGMLVSLLTTFFVTNRHPLESYRESVPLVTSYLLGNTVYGAVVMTCHALLLPLLFSS
jgi:hypothetical protein